MQHPDFAILTVSWELALRADGYAENTVRASYMALGVGLRVPAGDVDLSAAGRVGTVAS